MDKGENSEGRTGAMNTPITTHYSVNFGYGWHDVYVYCAPDGKIVMSGTPPPNPQPPQAPYASSGTRLY
jgi:hypothetical protein